MIEQGLYFTLGFVAAALLALVVLPAFWRRAYRLTRREIEATLPLSPTEIAAERDQLRAKFAVERVRLEQETAAARDGRQKAMAEAGGKALRITALEDEVRAREGDIARQLGKIGSLEGTLANARDVIESQRSAIALAQSDIATLRAQQGVLMGEHRELGETSDTRRVQIASLETNMEAQRARVGELDRDLKAARAQVRTLTEETRAKDRAARDLEKELAVAVRKLESAEEIAEGRARVIAERDAAVAAAGDRIEALVKEARSRDDIIRRETRRAEAADKAAAEREQQVLKLREDGRAIAADLAQSTERLKADRQKLQGELAEARARAAQLQRELAALKRGAGKVADLRAKPADVRT